MGREVRNGATAKTLQTEHGPVGIRYTSRSPGIALSRKIATKRQRRFEGFDEKILALDAEDVDAGYRGSPARARPGSLGQDLISRVTDAAIEDDRAWQQRPLDYLYPVLYLDALAPKMR